MQALIMAAQLITGLSILVILHELGHYLAARAFKIRVEKFYLFFDAWGKKLFSFKRNGTEWGIGWLPLGGYVKIAGMIDESMDKDQMKRPAEPWEFRSKPAWQRLIVMLGGIIMNIIAGVIIFAMLKYFKGEEHLINQSVSYGVIPSELAYESGFRKGDELVAVNGRPIVYFEDAMNADVLLSDGPPSYLVKRNGSDTTIVLPKDYLNSLSKKVKSAFFMPRMRTYVKKLSPGSPADKAGLQPDDQLLSVNGNPTPTYDVFQPMLRSHAGSVATLGLLRGTDTLQLQVNVDKDSTIGFFMYDKSWRFDTTSYTFWRAFPAGADEAYQTIQSQVAGWGKIFKGEVAVNKAIQGPIGIAQFYGPVWDWVNFWLMTALISLGLAFFNVLPIPALDGGHVVLLLVEMVIGRPLSEKTMERIQTVGMVIILSLTVLIFGNDILGAVMRIMGK